MLQRKKACFSTKSMLKHAFLQFFQKNEKIHIPEKGLYSPAVAFVPFCGHVVHDHRYRCLERTCAGSGEIEQCAQCRVVSFVTICKFFVYC